jgi:hypothetical protein
MDNYEANTSMNRKSLALDKDYEEKLKLYNSMY